MKKYKAVIFDFDGTLANTYEGIFNSYTYAAQQLGLEKPTVELVDGAIGASPLEVFLTRFGLSEEKAMEATQIYRSRYKREGIFEVKLYDGMQQVLEFLNSQDIKIGIATLKLQQFASIMLDHLNIKDLFSDVSGADANDTLTKADIILQSLQNMGIDPSDAVLIGDSKYDAIGAEKAGVDFIAVTYGFGFKTLKDVSVYKTVAKVKSVAELKNLF